MNESGFLVFATLIAFLWIDGRDCCNGEKPGIDQTCFFLQLAVTFCFLAISILNILAGTHEHVLMSLPHICIPIISYACSVKQYFSSVMTDNAMLQSKSLCRLVSYQKISLSFLSATEYFPSRTVIQPGWVS